MQKKNPSRKLRVVVILLVIMLVCSVSVLAASQVSLGTGTVNLANGTINYDVEGYVYTIFNNGQEVGFDSFVMWVYNRGIYDINEAHFIAHDANFDKYTHVLAYSDGIEQYHSQRIESDWISVCWAEHQEDSVYEKNGSDQFVYSSMTAGINNANLGGWASYWFPSHREDDFHY